MSSQIRPATGNDIAAMHRIRMSVRENRLVTLSLSEGDYVQHLERRGRGWVAEQDGVVVAFAVADATNGSLWALFVDPDHEGRGHGRRLHDVAVRWLWDMSCGPLWLTTAPATRAAGFYAHLGWQDAGTTTSGERRFELRRPPTDA